MESKDTETVLTSLRKISSSEEHILGFRESVDLAVHGYDDDDRELFEIPEVCDYFSLLATEFPYFFWFLNTKTPTLKVIAFCVSGARRVNSAASGEIGSSVASVRLAGLGIIYLTPSIPSFSLN